MIAYFKSYKSVYKSYTSFLDCHYFTIPCDIAHFEYLKKVLLIWDTMLNTGLVTPSCLSLLSLHLSHIYSS